MHKVSEPTQHRAVVTMFGKKRMCQVDAHGHPKTEYTKDETLWVERGEEEYGVMSMKTPFCVLRKAEWVRGEEIQKDSK